MKKPFVFSEILLWCLTGFWVGLIYSTLSLVPLVRKMAVERFGQSVWDWVYVLFGVIGLAIVVKASIDFRGKQLVYRFVSLVLIGVLYSLYLIKLPYAIERIHFLEYGLVGILLYAAIAHRISTWMAAPLSIITVYYIGLGDEAIQHTIPARVGEIRDVITDLFSGILGIAMYLFAIVRNRPQGRILRKQVHVLMAFCSVAIAGTALFLWFIHGFGRVYETPGIGRFFSSLSPVQFDSINTSRSEATVSRKIQALYDDEALRHLLQRDFYYTNDFLISGGGFYRDYRKSYCENRVLETYYGRFLAGHAAAKSADLLKPLDPHVSQSIEDMTVAWPDSIRNLMERKEGNPVQQFESRVKSSVITSFTPTDLLLYTACVLFLLGFAWVKVPRIRP